MKTSILLLTSLLAGHAMANPKINAFYSAGELHRTLAPLTSQLDKTTPVMDTAKACIAEGYILGVLDLLQSQSQHQICPPTQLDSLQFAEHVDEWIADRPDQFKYSANSVIKNALLDLYPCKSK